MAASIVNWIVFRLSLTSSMLGTSCIWCLIANKLTLYWRQHSFHSQSRRFWWAAKLTPWLIRCQLCRLWPVCSSVSKLCNKCRCLIQVCKPVAQCKAADHVVLLVVANTTPSVYRRCNSYTTKDQLWCQLSRMTSSYCIPVVLTFTRASIRATQAISALKHHWREDQPCF